MGVSPRGESLIDLLILVKGKEGLIVGGAS